MLHYNQFIRWSIGLYLIASGGCAEINDNNDRSFYEI